MQQVLKAILFFAAIIGVIVLGLFWPSEDASTPDTLAPAGITDDMSAFGVISPPLPLETVKLHTVYSTLDAILDGRFQYREGDIAWTFTIPIDWGKPPDGLETRRVVQRLAMADPFLKAFDETGDKAAFRQAAFFMLDWQRFHQTGRRVTPHSWDLDAAEGRMNRLAFMLSAIENDPALLATDNTRSLIALADFHLRRLASPDYIETEYTSGIDFPQNPSVQTLCRVLDKLTSCP